MEQIDGIFLKTAYERVQKAEKGEVTLAHYTSAEAATSILQNGELWLRNTQVLNDSLELLYGHKCFQNFTENQYRQTEFFKLVNSQLKELSILTTQEFNRLSSQHLDRTYVFSFSEHSRECGIEQAYGRLSMWRAYGGAASVALLFNTQPMYHSNNAAPNGYLLPVQYLTQAGFDERLTSSFDYLAKNINAYMKKYDTQTLANKIALSMFMLTLITKHPGFSEEKEWRIIYTDVMKRAPNFKNTIEVINGIPQNIYKLAIYGEYAEMEETDFLIEGLEKIIIGPTSYPKPIARALARIVSDIGIKKEISEILSISEIPVRG